MSTLPIVSLDRILDPLTECFTPTVCDYQEGPGPDGAYIVSALSWGPWFTWSSSTFDDRPEDVWVINFAWGSLEHSGKTSASFGYRCVRGDPAMEP